MIDFTAPSYYADKEEYFNDQFQSIAIEIGNEVYKIKRDTYEDSSDIFESVRNNDGTMFFQVKYYNGGCCFGEALEKAIKNGK
jgi:hypothetical protein